MNAFEVTVLGSTLDVRITREWNPVRQRWEITIKDLPGGDIAIYAENCPRLIIT